MGEVLGGRYELLDVIGSGGMGTVWRARDLRTGADVAAKVLRQSDAGSLLRFIRETGFRIHHPHVLVPLGWVGEDDRVVLAMPLVDGGSVATLVGDHGALPPRLVAELLRQLLGALDAVHAAGVVHRDVKPANLLLRATGTGRPDLLLSDFGIATEVDGPRLTHADLVIGTPGYLAPEQLRGAEPHPAHDLFAAGMVAREMLTAQRPRVVASVPVVTDERPAGVPPELWQLVVELTRLDPAARPASAGAALARLDVPSLAWSDDALGEVEVIDQLAPATGLQVSAPAGMPTAPERPRAAPTPAPEPVRLGPVSLETQPAPVPESAVDDAPEATALLDLPTTAQEPQAVTEALAAPVTRVAPAPARPEPMAQHAAEAPMASAAAPPEPTPATTRAPERSFDHELPNRAKSPAAQSGPRPQAPLNGAVPLILLALIVLGLLIALVSWAPWSTTALGDQAPVVRAAVLRL